MKAIVLPLLLLLLSCSEANVYEGIQQNRQLECRQLPAAQYEDCMSQYRKDYREYREQLREVQQPNEATPRNQPAL